MAKKPSKKSRPKYGGRKKGTPNKKTSKAAMRAAAAAAKGVTPLEFLLEQMRNSRNSKDVRMQAAHWAAPYVHPKLQAITHTGGEGGPIQHVARIERVIVDSKN